MWYSRALVGLFAGFMIFFAAGCATAGWRAAPPTPPGEQVARTLDLRYRNAEAGEANDIAQYLIYIPGDYALKNKSYPLLLFLHGAGERGENLDAVKIHGPPMHIEQGEDYPFIVVSPQCPEGTWWEVEPLDTILREVQHDYRVDEDRIYVTGLSMGGFGTWRLAMAYPSRFAALVPIAGGGEPENAAKIAHTPQWIFHGADDQAVSVDQSQRMVDALKEAGAENIRFTVYPDAGHVEAWRRAYSNPELWEWLMKQRRR